MGEHLVQFSAYVIYNFRLVFHVGSYHFDFTQVFLPNYFMYPRNIDNIPMIKYLTPIRSKQLV